MSQQPSNARPTAVYKAGRLEVAVWVSQREGEGGKSYRHVAVSLSKSWKDADGTWKKGSVPLFMDDLGPVAGLLNRVFAEFGIEVQTPADRARR